MAVAMAAPAGDGTTATITTELGDIVIELYTESAPVAASNFINLAEAGFYDGLDFHRLMPGFVIQGGDGEFGRVGAPAVHYLHQSYSRTELAALYLAADVMAVTPLRDGMNLVAKEYVAARSDLGGALVLSEFAGAAIELPQAYMCNPHDINSIKDAVMRAVTASPEEASGRIQTMRRYLREHGGRQWAADFLAALSAQVYAAAHEQAHDQAHDQAHEQAHDQAHAAAHPSAGSTPPSARAAHRT